MVDKEKTSFNLGQEVRQFLLEKGVETPLLSSESDSKYKIETIKNSFEDIMKVMGLDLADDSLNDSPKRVAKMFVNELFYGLDYDNFPKCTVTDNKMGYKSMLIERDISSISTCEHHFVTIDGVCHIGYIPTDKVIGLSKLNRVVDFFSKRPQVQERLTLQIYYALSHILGTEDVAVVLDSKHYCVKVRGVKDINSSTITSKMGGVFYDDHLCRSEFLSLIKMNNKL